VPGRTSAIDALGQAGGSSSGSRAIEETELDSRAAVAGGTRAVHYRAPPERRLRCPNAMRWCAGPVPGLSAGAWCAIAGAFRIDRRKHRPQAVAALRQRGIGSARESGSLPGAGHCVHRRAAFAAPGRRSSRPVRTFLRSSVRLRRARSDRSGAHGRPYLNALDLSNQRLHPVARRESESPRRFLPTLLK